METINEKLGTENVNYNYSVPILEINEDVANNLLQASVLNSCNPYLSDFEAFASKALQIFTQLFPSDFLSFLRTFGLDPKSPAAFKIKGLPVDPILPETPSDGMPSPSKQTFVSETNLVGAAEIMGRVFSFANEKKGAFIHPVAPVKARIDAHSNEGSQKDFRLHTEVAHLDSRPDLLQLISLRSNQKGESDGGATTLATLSDALPFLSSNTIKLLRVPIYEVEQPESFRQPGSEKYIIRTAVISGPKHAPQVRLNFNTMKANTNEGKLALAELEEVMTSPEVLKKFYLKPGEMLIINNLTSVHGRTPFKPLFNGTDRWLQRVYVRRDLWGCRSLAPNILSFRVQHNF